MRRHWLATTALLLLPAAAGAEQFDYGIRTQGGWSDNVYGSSEDAETVSQGQVEDIDTVDDWSLRVSPWGKVSDLDGDVTWALQYQPSYEYYLSETDINGFDHDVGGQVQWRATDRTTLVATESFRKYRSLVRFNENAGETGESSVLRGEREELTGNQTTFGVRHMLSPRDEIFANATLNLRDYEQASDLSSTIVSGNYRRSLSPRTSLGLQASWIRQSFSREIGDDAITDYYNLSGTFDYQFSRTLRFEAYAGPAWIDADEEVINFSRKYGVSRVGNSSVALNANNCPLLNDTLPHQPDPEAPNYNPHVAQLGFGGCGIAGGFITPGEAELLGYPRGDPLLPGSTSSQTAKLSEFSRPYEFDASGSLQEFDDSEIGDVELTYFARAAIIKDWERWHAEFVYQRSSDDSGSFGTSSVRDSLELGVRWEPARLWTISFVGEYALLDQASDLVIPSLLIVENEPVPAGVDSVSEIATVQRLVVDLDDNALSYTSMSASLTATRRLTERSSVFAAVYWYDQEQDRDLDRSISFIPGVSGASQSTSSWNNLTFWVGFDWQFESIKF